MKMKKEYKLIGIGYDDNQFCIVKNIGTGREKPIVFNYYKYPNIVSNCILRVKYGLIVPFGFKAFDR